VDALGGAREMQLFGKGAEDFQLPHFHFVSFISARNHLHPNNLLD